MDVRPLFSILVTIKCLLCFVACVLEPGTLYCVVPYVKCQSILSLGVFLLSENDVRGGGRNPAY